MIFSIIVCVAGLITTIVVGKFLKYNAGQAGGLAAGALTQSATIGVAQDAISKMSMAGDTLKTMQDFVPVGYAVTYIFGTIGVAFILTTLGPNLLGIDLYEACKKLESDNKRVIEGHGIFLGTSDLDYRTYLLNEDLEGKTVAEAEEEISQNDIRVFILRIKRENTIIIPKAEEIIQKDDRCIFSFKNRDIRYIDFEKLGAEVSDYDLMNLPLERLEVSLKEGPVTNKPIKVTRKETLTRGVYISKVLKKGAEIDYNWDTVLVKGDIITLTGPKEDVESLAYKIGRPIRDTSETDMIFVGLGILLGGIIGIPALTIKGVGLNLSTSGGALIMGLIFGYIHSRNPRVGSIPEGAVWFLSNVGLAMFIAVVGINAGPAFVSGLRVSEISFLIAGIIVSTVPVLVGILVGKYIFKWEPPLILGACAGALTTTAAVGALCEKAKSNVPVLSYTVTYAVGNILLTLWGTIVVLMFS